MSDSIDLFFYNIPLYIPKFPSGYSSGGVPQYNPVEKAGNGHIGLMNQVHP